MTKSDEALLARVGKFWQTLNEPEGLSGQEEWEGGGLKRLV